MSNLDSTALSSVITGRVKFAQFLQSSSSAPNTINTTTTPPSPPHYPHQHQEEEEESFSSDSDSEHLSSSSASSSTSRRPSRESSSHEHSPYTKSPWLKFSPVVHHNIHLIGSLVREDGHVYSLATSSHFLYTGSDSNNIHVWTKSGLHDSGGFKSSSGLVKSIVVGPDNNIFTGHQDGKIRVWQPSPPQHPTTSPSSSSHKRLGSLPKWRDSLKHRLLPSSNTRRHSDAVSCLSLDKEAGLLYSASWDKTVKVWRLKDSKCVDSIQAHDDVVNAVVVATGMVFTGSADGTVKVWRRRELLLKNGKKRIRHVRVQTLLEQTTAVTSLAVMMVTSSSSSCCCTLYAGSSDGLVSFWELKKDTIINYGGVLRGHKLAVLCLATAGSLVLTGSADNTVCVWRREEAGVGGDHVCLSVLTGHNGPVKCLAVHQEEEQVFDTDIDIDRQWRVYSGSLDNSVKVWTVTENII